jgi:hypothetical protein
VKKNFDFKLVNRNDYRLPTIFGADDGLLETLLTEVGVNVVGRAGRVTSLGIETGIPEQVAEVLENVQQLLGSILEDSQHLERSGHKISASVARCLSRLRIFSIVDPGSASKNLSILTQNNGF